jgi:hypothetical protein
VDPTERQKIRLKITPTGPTVLDVVGVAWFLTTDAARPKPYEF